MPITILTSSLLLPFLNQLQPKQFSLEDYFQGVAVYYGQDAEEFQNLRIFRLSNESIKKNVPGARIIQIEGGKKALFYFGKNTESYFNTRKLINESLFFLSQSKEPLRLQEIPDKFRRTISDIFTLKTGCEPEDGTLFSGGLELGQEGSINNVRITRTIGTTFPKTKTERFSGLDCKLVSEEKLKDLIKQYGSTLRDAADEDIRVVQINSTNSISQPQLVLSKSLRLFIEEYSRMSDEHDSIWSRHLGNLKGAISIVESQRKSKLEAMTPEMKANYAKLMVKKYKLPEGSTLNDLERATKMTGYRVDKILTAVYRQSGVIQDSSFALGRIIPPE